MKKFIFLILILVIAVGAGQGLHYVKDGFTGRRIHSLSHTVSDDFDAEVKAALSKSYHYIGRGRQCFAFASADDKYVLKFPRTDIYKTPFWVRALPVQSYRQKLEQRHAKREQSTLESFHISLEKLKNQTGVLAVHLGQSPSKEKLTVTDALGFKHQMTLGKTSFILQYKQPILFKIFSTALQNGKRNEAKQILDSLFKVVAERAEKGVLNHDPSFLRNYGFDGTNAYLIDIGTFYRIEELDPEAAYQKSLRETLAPVQEWLAKTDPEMLLYLNEKLYK